MRAYVWAIGVLAACAAPGGGAGNGLADGSEGGGADDAPEGPGPAVTYHRDVRPILEQHCGGCHAPGGIGPFSVGYAAEEWAQGPAWWTAPAVGAVTAGTMPPWNPADDCHPIVGSRKLPAEAEETLFAWRDLGFPEGDPADYAVPTAGEVDALGPPDLAFAIPEAYTPRRDTPDDYRCFPFYLPADGPTAWMRAFQVAADRSEVVHHVILYRLDPALADRVRAWDEEDPGTGYTCYGSPGTWQAETLAGWAPGSPPEVYDEGVARAIEPGSVLVLQMHYNVLNIPHDAAVPADQTGIELWTLPEGELPQRQIFSVPLAKTDLDIPAGAPQVVQSDVLDLRFLPRRFPLRGVFPHMHQLGTGLRVDVLREDGSEDCLIDIPAWDFNWQQAYFFPIDDAIGVGREDKVRITCTYDNTASNQPVFNGVQAEPRDVTWGDGTRDEMCLAYLYGTFPPGSFPIEALGGLLPDDTEP